MVGSTIPFSPFECATTWPTLNAMQFCYRIGSNFITGAPPEFEDPLTLRLCMNPKFNDPSCWISKQGFKPIVLPDHVHNNTTIMVRMTALRPLLQAQNCHHKLHISDTSCWYAGHHHTVQVENVKKKQRAGVQGRPLDKDTLTMLNTPCDALSGKLQRQHPIGPIVWWKTCHKQDAYNCKNNIITTNLFNLANNSSPITSTTSGKATKEYICEHYIVKELANLKQTFTSSCNGSDSFPSQ